MRIGDRLRRLEGVGSGRDGSAERCDADHVLRTVERLADRFSTSAATIPLAERLATMSPAQHCAWEMRFASEQTPVASIMAMHGHSLPLPGSIMEDRQHAAR